MGMFGEITPKILRRIILLSKRTFVDESPLLRS